MDFFTPTTWSDALAVKAEHPQAQPIAGGTDVMVELNFDRGRPTALLDLTRISELTDWSRDDDRDGTGRIRLGAGVTYARVQTELAQLLPGLAAASRTVGSPQIRNRGTVGGNLGSASPAGDAHPPLLAGGAVVEVASVRGTRQVPIGDFYLGVKRNALAPDELIAAVTVEVATGPQRYAKVGPRNAMVIAVAAFGLALHPVRRQVGAAIGSAAPTPRRTPDAESFLAAELDRSGLWDSRGALPDGVATRFGELVAAAATPIDDVRGTAAYRRHALSVLARRTAVWSWQSYRTGS